MVTESGGHEECGVIWACQQYCQNSAALVAARLSCHTITSRNCFNQMSIAFALRSATSEQTESIYYFIRSKIRQRYWNLIWRYLSFHKVRRKGNHVERASKTEVSRQLVMHTCWEDKVSPTHVIRAAEDRLLWHQFLQMVANVIHDVMAP